MIEWLALLLPVAAASGWWVARRQQITRVESRSSTTPAFFKGLNYLLDEQPDKAIDVFLELAEVDGETVDTHLSLGILFRRRGEVERAIRIHQNLVARTNLSNEQRSFALFELAQDYMRAGLFDRAEGLFRELLTLGLQRRRALKGLIEIYQQEKDWQRCLGAAEQLRDIGGMSMATELSQFHCELAEDALGAGDADSAEIHLRRAQDADPGCVRATMLQARMEVERGDLEAAAALYGKVVEQGAETVPEVFPNLLAVWRHLGRKDLLLTLQRLYGRYPSPALMLMLADLTHDELGADGALHLLTEYLAGNADLAALERLLELQRERLSGEALYRQDVVLEVVRHLHGKQSAYQCERCGFPARLPHWQCPSCKHWDSIKPVAADRLDVVLKR